MTSATVFTAITICLVRSLVNSLAAVDAVDLLLKTTTPCERNRPQQKVWWEMGNVARSRLTRRLRRSASPCQRLQGGRAWRDPNLAAREEARRPSHEVRGNALGVPVTASA